MIIIPQHSAINPTIIISYDYNGKSNRILTSYSKETLEYLKSIQAKLEDCESFAEQKDLYETLEMFASKPVETNIMIEDDFVLDAKTNKHYLLTKEGFKLEVALPEIFVDVMLEHRYEEKDYQYLVNFWMRLLASPVANNTAEGYRFIENVCKFVFKNEQDIVIKEKLMAEGYTEEVAARMSYAPTVKITRDGITEMLRCIDPTNTIYIFDVDADGQAVRTLKEGLLYDCDKKTGKTFVTDLAGTVITTEEEYFESLDIEDWSFQPPVMKQSGDAFYCGSSMGHEIKIGQVVRLPDWSYVNTNQHSSCVKGLICSPLFV